MSVLPRLRASGLALFATLVSASAWACPVCGAATDTKGTYQGMTIVMSGLPLLLIFGIVGWVALRVRRAAKEES